MVRSSRLSRSASASRSIETILPRAILLLDAGAQPLQAINDVGGGKLIASVKDANDNIIGLLQSQQ
jgi:hypothetical protein